MSASSVIDKMLDPFSQSLNGKAARALIELKLDLKVQKRIDKLAEECNEGDLTPQERDEYESYISAGSVIAILQAKARIRLSRISAR